jgi:nitrate reductase gamma subunit
MEAWVTFARGPLWQLAVAILALGVLRQLALTLGELVLARRRAGDQVLPVRSLFRRSLGWILPVHALRGTRIPYTLASLVFHAGVLLVPLFLSGHVQLIRRGLGIGWPGLPSAAADTLTLGALGALAALAFLRIVDRASRVLSGFQDWFLLGLCGLVFLSGYAVAHPAANPLPFPTTYLVHLLSAELLLILLPFTKLAHALLFPFTQVSWELGWHFVPGAGERVRAALGKEGERI